MTDWRHDYWAECLSEAAQDCGLKIESAQLDCLASAVKGAHENYGMYSGDEVASVNLTRSHEREVADLKKAVERERNKVMCRTCGGAGRIYTQGPHHGSDTECWKCHGEGRHD